MIPKPKFILVSTAMVLLSLFNSRGMAETQPREEVQADVKIEKQVSEEKLLEEMTAAEKEISDRTGMSSLLERDDESDNDPRIDQKIDAALKSGWIIHVTIDEVAAALARAASTSSEKDDVAAMELAHRGSYRYYFSSQEQRAGATVGEQNK